jgi:hypothetical protein
MNTLLSSAKSIFDNFAHQLDTAVHEFNSLRGGQGLRCERTAERIVVYKELNPRVSVELEFDEAAGTVRMLRQRLGATVTDLRYTVDRDNQVNLDRADYCRLARQALRPLMDAFV